MALSDFRAFRRAVRAAAAVGGLLAAVPVQAVPISAPFETEITIDLGDAQNQMERELNSIRHVDRCHSNWNVWDAKVLPNGHSINVDLNARFYENQCTIITVPEWHGLFHMEWHDRVVEETTLISQAGHFAVDIWPVIEGENITVNAQVVTADANGLLGRLKINGQIKDFLTPKIRDALRDKVHAKLPPEFAKAGVKMDVSFIDLGGGKLGMKVKATGKVSAS
jgi:hypothetical protein